MDRIISKFRKNSIEEIQVRLREYEGRHLIDLRTFVGPRGQETLPTKKGISIPIELFPNLKEAIQQVEEALDEDDLARRRRR